MRGSLLASADRTSNDPALVDYLRLTGGDQLSVRVLRATAVAVFAPCIFILLLGFLSLETAPAQDEPAKVVGFSTALIVYGLLGSVVAAAIGHWAKRRAWASVPEPAAAGPIGIGIDFVDRPRDDLRPSWRAALAAHRLQVISVGLFAVATVLRLDAGVQTEHEIVGVVCGLLIGLYAVAGIYLVVVHRGTVAARRLPQVRWISRRGVLLAAQGREPASTEEFLRTYGRRVSVRLVLAEDGFFIVPGRLRPKTVLSLDIADVTRVSVVSGRRQESTVTLIRSGGSRTMLAVEGRTLIAALQQLGARLDAAEGLDGAQ